MGPGLESLLRRVMVRVAMVDGELHGAEIDRLRWNVGRLSGTVPSEAQVRRDVAEVVAQAVPLTDLLAQARASLDLGDRQTLVQAAYLIATADGEVPAAEDALLVEIARGLEIPPEQYHALVSPMGLARVLRGK